MKIVIVGGVAGGASAAARIRRNDESAEIVMFERGEHISFANCGIPYYIGGSIEEYEDLLLQTPMNFKSRYNVDVRTNSEVISIDTKNKNVIINDLIRGIEYKESYDKLILSPGARPIKPSIKGIDQENVFTIRNPKDALEVKTFISNHKCKKAAVIGGGYIGIEMADNLYDMGLDVSIIEAMPHIIGTLDDDMVAEVQNHIRGKGAKLYLKSKAVEIDQYGVLLENGNKVEADIIIMSIGVSPDTEFLKNSDIKLGRRGEIFVDNELKTNIDDIYAVGDAVSTYNIVSKTSQVIALASPANKQARIVADIIAGKSCKYSGTQGTAIVKAFDMVVATTGYSETQLINSNIKYLKSITSTSANASYYKGESLITIKLLFDQDNGKVLGGQVIGEKGVDKRIDIVSTAIRHAMTVYDMQELELAYAPPFSSAKDPINMAGYIAENIISGMCKPIYVEELDDFNENSFLLDVRRHDEFNEGTIGNAINIELDKLRENLDKIPKDKEIIIICRTGLRAHIAQQLLEQSGFNTKNLIGGYKLYNQTKLNKLS